jgi:hypothetical protein
MKRFSILALGILWMIALSLGAAANPQLKQVTTVYILSMGAGMDQFLANQLTNAGVFRIVTDPKQADAILTDRLGEPFEKKFDELYPPPPTPEQLKKEAEAKEANDKLSPGQRRSMDLGGGGADRATSSSFNRGKGNFFLVDRKSRSVLWSVYEPPAKDSTPAALTKVAARVVKRLQADLSDKKQGGE